MQKFFFLLAAILLHNHSFSQARLATADYQKTVQPALEIEIPFTEKIVSKAIDDKMQKMGYKGKDSKGYLTYKGVHLAELGPDAYDLYFGTERKKDFTIVTMMISSGYEKFIGDTTNAPVVNNAKTFLNSLTNIVAAFDLEQQIGEQENILKKAYKRLTNLAEDGQGLQRKKAKLEQELQDNLKQQADQKTEAAKQRQILETLKAKRKQ